MTPEERIVAARLRLKERWESRMRETQGMSDADAQGSGPPNRPNQLNQLGLPKIPPGQHLASKWPVLDLGWQPTIETPSWKLTLDGACRNPVTLTWKEFMALDQVEDVSDFHCVTTWSVLDMNWVGVRFSDLAALVEPTEEASFILCHANDQYTTNIPLEEALKPDVLLVHSVNGESLSRDHGGPVRMITPQLYAWKGAKWICRIEFLTKDQPGYWEQRGYSNTAHPWKEDRYS